MAPRRRTYLDSRAEAPTTPGPVVDPAAGAFLDYPKGRGSLTLWADRRGSWLENSVHRPVAHPGPRLAGMAAPSPRGPRPGPASLAAGDAAVELTEGLVALDTVNPGLVEGAPGEWPAVDLLAPRLEAGGFACTVLTGPGPAYRPSLLALRPGDPGRRTLLLNGHLDTVGTAGMAEPFTPRIVGDRLTGRLHGRGACDMKAGVAALVAAAEAAAADPAASLALALVADEEDASTGTESIIDHLAQTGLHPDACLVGEPTWLDLAVAHRGFAVVDVALRGRAAHSSRPAEGVNAVTHLGRLLGAVEAGAEDLAARPPHPLLGHGSLMATVVEGGTAPFTLAATAFATIERRTLPGETSADALAEVEAVLAALRAADPTVDAVATLRVAREAWEQDSGATAGAVAAMLMEALPSAGATAPGRVGAPYWMESALWQAAGIPTVVCGPAGGGLHSDVEWVELAQVRAYAAAVADVLVRF